MRKLLASIGLALVTALAVPSAASAAGDTIPHGGYDTTTDSCLQCHDIHEAGSDYVLLRWKTVTATCGSCHYLYLGEYPQSAGGSPGGGEFNPSPAPGQVPAYDPGYSGRETEAVLPTNNSLGSRTSAYETEFASRYTANGHTLERGVGLHLFSDGNEKPGDYIPGGLQSLSAVQLGGITNSLSFAGTNGLYCGSCHTPHGQFGQLLAGASIGSQAEKVLSSKPNHRSNAISINDWFTTGGEWCASCHERRPAGAVDPATGSTLHNHPTSACLACHANDSAGQNSDFPHTGQNANLLAAEPDALCLICHKSGQVP